MDCLKCSKFEQDDYKNMVLDTGKNKFRIHSSFNEESGQILIDIYDNRTNDSKHDILNLVIPTNRKNMQFMILDNNIDNDSIHRGESF
jgi:hypothetical protein